MKKNPRVLITVDRDETNEMNKGSDTFASVVATFDAPIKLYRVMDGEELALVVKTGIIKGGLFATEDERKYGASWTSTLEGLVDWGRSWSRGKRLGKDLFVAEVNAHGCTFFHMNLIAQDQIPFDPAGERFQTFEVEAGHCDTGLGCSMTVPTKSATFYRPSKDGTELVPMTREELQAYVEKKPRAEVSLRDLGSGRHFGGTIRDESVVIGQDHEDKLWFAERRDGSKFLVGAKTRKQATEKAQEIIARGIDRHTIVRLNRVPERFNDVEEGQIWTSVVARQSGRKAKVREVGASYVVTTWLKKEEWESSTQRWSAMDFLKFFAFV